MQTSDWDFFSFFSFFSLSLPFLFISATWKGLYPLHLPLRWFQNPLGNTRVFPHAQRQNSRTGEAWVKFPLPVGGPVTLRDLSLCLSFPLIQSISNTWLWKAVSGPWTGVFGVYFSHCWCQEDLICMAEFDCSRSALFSVALVSLPRQKGCLGCAAAVGWGRDPSQLPVCPSPPSEPPNPTMISPLVPGSQSPLFTAKPCSPAKSCCCAICLFMNFLVDWMFVGSQ